jgi:hypothetical protein
MLAFLVVAAGSCPYPSTSAVRGRMNVLGLLYGDFTDVVSPSRTDRWFDAY